MLRVSVFYPWNYPQGEDERGQAEGGRVQPPAPEPQIRGPPSEEGGLKVSTHIYQRDNGQQFMNRILRMLVPDLF